MHRQVAWKNSIRYLLLALLASMLWVTPVWATSATEIPFSGAAASVIDEGNVLSAVTEGSVGRSLQDLSEATGINVHIVTLHRLDYGETPQSFVDDLFSQWFPDPESQANQVIIALDTVTNGTAIHYGEAVAERLNPDTAESIVQETMRVPLRDGNYNQSVLDTVNRLTKVLKGEPDPGPPVVRETIVEKTYKSKEETDDRSATIIVVALLIAATVIPMVTYFMYQGSS
ncbi:MAG: TPM domain-containing protein [Thermosynechococcus sp. Uc]|uniref:photosystem II repair protein Psb32 n=1 Tax=Thermosynechococcus sp. Uc TaxID=3034853 RepID=UPI001A0BF0C1|nr:TPM domain-containing protein [Thermosynechococcus sp. Uc]MDM7326178.1 TPM domain-containing protein [Thermosynechococcus sp. Uc]HIK25094.1 TPM domain-containing protein [Thermosynechococcus sp. M46_R2017_013]